MNAMDWLSEHFVHMRGKKRKCKASHFFLVSRVRSLLLYSLCWKLPRWLGVSNHRFIDALSCFTCTERRRLRWCVLCLAIRSRAISSVFTQVRPLTLFRVIANSEVKYLLRQLCSWNSAARNALRKIRLTSRRLQTRQELGRQRRCLRTPNQLFEGDKNKTSQASRQAIFPFACSFQLMCNFQGV